MGRSAQTLGEVYRGYWCGHSHKPADLPEMLMSPDSSTAKCTMSSSPVEGVGAERAAFTARNLITPKGTWAKQKSRGFVCYFERRECSVRSVPTFLGPLR
jgi:hypothetical protein